MASSMRRFFGGGASSELCAAKKAATAAFRSPSGPACLRKASSGGVRGRVRRYPFVGAAIVQEEDRDSSRIFRGDSGAFAFEASFPRDEEQADVEGGGDPVRVTCKGSGMERGCRREGGCEDVGSFFGRGVRVRVGVWRGL